MCYIRYNRDTKLHSSKIPGKRKRKKCDSNEEVDAVNLALKKKKGSPAPLNSDASQKGKELCVLMVEA
ncbi:UNVERIFIED_CONTAM: hypothetical protein PYX00_005764 [Menopon gallinae]|uniref:Uncharacterized protein n=1 Tax=Menopon gallinae TaxID=328185 RepID=A0AAW2HU47_9NEOP